MRSIFLRGVSAFAALALMALTAAAAMAQSPVEYRARASRNLDKVGEDDIRAEVQFGREVAARLLGKLGHYENEALTRYVNLVASALARQSGRPEIEFRVAVLKSDTINAYAAPGGYLFVTLGAIKQMKDEAELAAVIAHEMSHITGRHIVKDLNIQGSDSSPVSGFARFLGGSGDPAKVTFLASVDKAMDMLFENGYKKEDERDADTRGITMMALSGYDPEAMVRYFERIKGVQTGDLSVLTKTHPSFDERIALLRGVMESEGLKGEYHKGGERFNEMAKNF